MLCLSVHTLVDHGILAQQLTNAPTLPANTYTLAGRSYNSFKVYFRAACLYYEANFQSWLVIS